MILLKPSQYDLVLEPLLQLPTNSLYFRAIVENRSVTGRVYVDKIENPESFYIIHPCGMSVVFGKPRHRHHNGNEDEWLLSYPNIENPDLYFFDVHKSIGNFTRIQFELNPDKHHYEEKPGMEVVKVDRDIYQQLALPIHPKYYWDSMDDFLNIGFGFSVMVDGIPVSTTFSSVIVNDVVDIGIQTLDIHRGNNYSVQATRAMIDYCLKNNMKVIAGTFTFNDIAIRVLEKVGFEIVESLPCHGIGYG